MSPVETLKVPVEMVVVARVATPAPVILSTPPVRRDDVAFSMSAVRVPERLAFVALSVVAEMVVTPVMVVASSVPAKTLSHLIADEPRSLVPVDVAAMMSTSWAGSMVPPERMFSRVAPPVLKAMGFEEVAMMMVDVPWRVRAWEREPMVIAAVGVTVFVVSTPEMVAPLVTGRAGAAPVILPVHMEGEVPVAEVKVSPWRAEVPAVTCKGAPAPVRVRAVPEAFVKPSVGNVPDPVTDTLVPEAFAKSTFPVKVEEPETPSDEMVVVVKVPWPPWATLSILLTRRDVVALTMSPETVPPAEPPPVV